MCFRWFHKWKVIRVQHYNDTSWCGKGDDGEPSTSVTWKCEKCGKIKVKGLYGAGYLTKEEVEI